MHPSFKSGQWNGFYTYPWSAKKSSMTLALEFEAGLVSGQGADNVGKFSISGTYSSETENCLWVKTYPGSHSVDYQGKAGEEGILGKWKMPFLGFFFIKGGFHIWPAPESQLISGNPQPTSPPQRQGLMGWLGVLGVMVLKYGWLAVKSLKTSLSMLVMIWVYSWLFGWKFAAGFVFLIFVHEMGHFIAAKRLGMPITAPIFIPFIGASITMKQHPRDAWTEALMAYGGPLAGGIGSWICWGMALELQLPWLLAVASVSFLMNLFNMIPVPPLDGGRICAAVSPWFWFVGLLLLGASVFYFHAWNSIWIILIVLFIAIPRFKKTFFQPSSSEMERYYATHISKRIAMALLYVGLIAVLFLGYWDSHQRLQQAGYSGRPNPASSYPTGRESLNPGTASTAPSASGD